MRNFTITGHMVVKNEDKWIWFSIMSVIDFLDKLIIFDTGSIDHTKYIIKQIASNKKYKDKIYFQEIGQIDPKNFYKIRQSQIDMTDTDYFMVIDGDEIWYKDSLEELNRILKDKPKLVATKFINACRDIYHYRYDNKESYTIEKQTGAITIRVYSKSIPGISCSGNYGVEGYIDNNGKSVQNQKYSIIIQKGKFFHTSLLIRSSKQIGDFSIKYRRHKFLAVPDSKFDDDFKYPEVFYSNNLPKYVKSPFSNETNFIRCTINYLQKLIQLIRK